MNVIWMIKEINDIINILANKCNKFFIYKKFSKWNKYYKQYIIIAGFFTLEVKVNPKKI